MRVAYNITETKQLRQRMTDAEQRLWYRLRERRFDHVKFHRRRTIWPYICDFVCIKNKLLIEVGGASHVDAQTYGAARTTYLENHGFRIIRFWNNEVMHNIEGIFQARNVS